MQVLPHVEWKRVLYVAVVCLFFIGVSAFIIFVPRSGINNASIFLQLPNEDGIAFLGHIYQVDVPNRTISVSWLIGGCGNFRMDSAIFTGSYCGLAGVPIDVYVNGQVHFHYDPTMNPINPFIYVQSINEFQYKHIMDIGTEELGSSYSFEQNFFYPFEQYRLTTTFIAFNTATNTSLPILRLVFSDYANNFGPQVEEFSTQTLMNNTLMNSRTTQVALQRISSARAFVVLLFLLNWLLTGTVMYITSIALWSDIKLGEAIIILPMTMILTLPALRNLFVDAPSFGVFFDSVGLIVQMVLVAICSVALLFKNVTVKNKPPQEASDLNMEDHGDITRGPKTTGPKWHNVLIDYLRLSLQMIIGGMRNIILFFASVTTKKHNPPQEASNTNTNTNKNANTNTNTNTNVQDHETRTLLPK